jgi:hypothetical protein
MPEWEEKEKIPLGETIASHSSFLTNRRIDDILKEIDRTKLNCWRNPCLPNLEEYFSAIYCLFDEVFSVLSKKEIEKLKAYFSRYWETYTQIKTDRTKQNIKTLYFLLFICDKINQSLRAGLQKYGYFFVKYAREPKRIEEALAVIEAGGGIFGGVSELSKNTNKSEREEH